jgi:hypothetical protein
MAKVADERRRISLGSAQRDLACAADGKPQHGGKIWWAQQDSNLRPAD